MNLTPRQIVKKIAAVVVTYGSGLIVYGIINNNVDTERIDKKVAVTVASMGISTAVNKMAAPHVNRTIDDIFDFFEGVKTDHEETES